MSDRSDEALRERLELARKATDGPWKESVQIVNGQGSKRRRVNQSEHARRC